MFRPEGIYRLRAPWKATTLVYRLKIFQRDSDKLLLILLIHQTWPCIIGPKQHPFLGNNLSLQDPHELCQIPPGLCKVDWHWTSAKQPAFPHGIQVLRDQRISSSSMKHRALHCYLYEAQILNILFMGKGICLRSHSSEDHITLKLGMLASR